jgi:hypothetical protein
MGLALTFISQIIAARPERKLRDAVSKATRKALQRRKDVSTSQAEIVTQSAERIELAMRPLSDLKDTLTQSIQPVVEVFGKQLNSSLKLVELQFGNLQESTNSLHNAVTSVETGITTLNAAAANLKGLLENAPEVLQGIIQLQGSQQQSLDRFNERSEAHLDQANKMNAALNDTVLSLNKLPQDLLRDTRSALHLLVEDSLSIWRTMSDAFGRRLSSDYDILLKGIAANALDIKESVTSVLHELDQAAQNTTNVLQALNELPESVRTDIKEAFGDLSAQSIVVWQKMSEEFGRSLQSQSIEYLNAIQSGANKVSVALENAAQTWDRIARDTEPLLREPIERVLELAKNELTEGLRQMDQVLAVKYPQASHDVLTFTESLKVLLNQVQAIQKEFISWLEETKQAQANIHRIHEDLVKTINEIRETNGRDVANLLQDNIEQLKGTNKLLEQIQSRIPSTGNGIHGDLQNSIRLLKQIRKGIDDMANKEGVVRWVASKWPWSRTQVKDSGREEE